jgi:uncharacterized membrane protein YobD (UPF0266 family)
VNGKTENNVTLLSRSRIQSYDRYMLWVILVTIIVERPTDITSETSTTTLWQQSSFTHNS